MFATNIRNKMIEAAFSAFPKLYFRVSSTTVNPDGTGFTEPAASTGYVPIEIINNTTNWSAAVDGEKHNLVAHQFPKILIDTPTITDYFLSATINGVAEIAGKFVDSNGVLQPRPMPANSTLTVNVNEAKFEVINPPSIGK